MPSPSPSRTAERAFPAPRLLIHSYMPNRPSFAHPVETRPDWVMLVLEKGQFRYHFGDGTEHRCRRGDIFLCPAGVPFWREAIGPIVFHFIQFRWAPRDPSAWAGHWTIGDAARFESTCEHWRRLAGGVMPGETAAWREHLLDDMLRLRSIEAARMRFPDVKADRLMARAADRIGRELTEGLSLAGLARELGLSPFQLSRRFRTAFGMSPGAYRTRARLNHARHLLRETDWTTDRIATESGFQNGFYFSRVFSREYACPPTEFRHLNRV